MDIYAGLNEQQLRAVTAPDGPLLVLAGAGSGKTRVLTHRIAHLIKEGVSPKSIMAVTFTKKAANEMKERLGELVSAHIDQLWVGTFHSICCRLLRSHANLVRLKPNFTIYDEQDSLAALKEVAKDLGIGRDQIPAVRNFIAKNKITLTRPEDCDPSLSSDWQEAYARYQSYLEHSNAVDFDDLITKMAWLLQNNMRVRQQIQQQFTHILVDEYQDVNYAQYQLVKLFAGERANITIVGDDYQAIYGFRGSDITGILNFERDFKNAMVVKLEQNYRSTSTIVEAGNSVIRNNKKQKAKVLWTQHPRGNPIQVYTAWDPEDEASLVAYEIERLIRNDVPLDQITVLYRMNYLSREIEQALMERGIPYKLVKGTSFYERREVKDCIAYMRLAINPNDSAALLRVINEPKRGIGKQSVEQLTSAADTYDVSLYQALSAECYSKALSSRFKAFKELIDSLQATDIREAFDNALHKTGYYRALQAETEDKKKAEEAVSRLRNLEEFGRAIQAYTETHPGHTVIDFLSDLSLYGPTENDDVELDDAPRVQLMTVHASKGLEFEHVFVVGLEEGVFPSWRALEEDLLRSRGRAKAHVCGNNKSKEEPISQLLHGRRSYNPFKNTFGYAQCKPSRYLAELEDLLDIDAAILEAM